MSRCRFLLLPLILLLALAARPCFAEPESGALSTAMSEPQYQSYLGQALMWQRRLAVEEKKFVPAFYATGVMNHTFLILFRFQPGDSGSLNLYGRHMTILFDSRSDLVGMVRVKPDWAEMTRVDDKTAVERAAAFVWDHAPELFRYVESHDVLGYTIDTQKKNGERTRIEGALVKYMDTKRGTCFFVVIAPDKSVMAFERNIIWDEKHGRRQNESFLYDTWLEKHGYRGH